LYSYKWGDFLLGKQSTVSVSNIKLMILSLIPLGYIIKGGYVGGIADITLLLYFVAYLFLAYEILIKGEYLNFFKVDILICLWIIIVSSSILYTPNQPEALLKLAKFLIMGISLIVFCRVFIKYSVDINQLYKYLIFFSSLVEVVVIAHFMYMGFPFGRYQFLEVNPIPLTMLAVTKFLIVFIIFFYRRMNKFNLLLLIPSTIVMALGSSKGPILSLILTLIMLSPIFLKRLKVIHVRWLFLISIISTYIIMKTNFYINFYTLWNRFAFISEDLSTIQRLQSYKEAYDIFSDFPIIGGGLSVSGGHYPHNIVLEILSENGLLLFSIFAVFIYILLKIYINTILYSRNNQFIVLSLALLILSLFTLMFSWTYMDHKYFYISIGLLIVSLKMKNQSKERVNNGYENEKY
jgi:O-antigen ligase